MSFRDLVTFLIPPYMFGPVVYLCQDLTSDNVHQDHLISAEQYQMSVIKADITHHCLGRTRECSAVTQWVQVIYKNLPGMF